MKIDRQQIGTVEVLAPVGALVDQDVESLAVPLRELVRGAYPRVVVSMEGVPYMDSAAIEMLLDAADELSDRAITLKLARVSATCREILELTGVARNFSFFTEVTDAVRSFL